MQKGSDQAESKSLPDKVFLRYHPCIFRQIKTPAGSGKFYELFAPDPSPTATRGEGSKSPAPIILGACPDLFTEFFFKYLCQRWQNFK